MRLAELRDEPFVTLTHASRLRHVLEAACASAGFVPRVAVETTDLAVMVMLAAEGVGSRCCRARASTARMAWCRST